MFAVRVLNKLRPQRQCFYPLQTCAAQKMKSNKAGNAFTDDQDKTAASLGEMRSKYQVFRDEDSEVILDIYEQNHKQGSALDNVEEEEDSDMIKSINLERGIDGVYDIEDLVQILRLENAQDIFVASVPQEIKYVNYICVVTGKSQRHMQAIAQFVRKIYKKKRFSTDVVPKLEGGDSKDWLALDLGNIALHIFSKEARILYDLDSLWALGPQYDAECNKKDPIVEMLEKHSHQFLHDLHPAR